MHLEFFIDAPIEVCFDLSRSIEFHTQSTSGTNEKAVGGRTTGLIELGETVTWQATHFGIRQKLTSKITAFERPFHFWDEQVEGVFKSIEHHHYFEQIGYSVKMIDKFQYVSPLGLLGKLADVIFLKRYMKHFLVQRNDMIKKVAESGQYQSFIN